MKKTILYSIIISSLFVGCSTKAVTPIDVTKSFWKAEKKENLKEAKNLSFNADNDDVKLHKTIKIEGFKIGTLKQKGDKAEVKTILFLNNPIIENSQKSIKIDFNTTLLKDKTKWKVDIDSTKRSLYAESAKQFSVDLFSTLKDKLGDFQILKNTFEKVINEVKENINKKQ